MIILPPDIQTALSHLSQAEKEKFCFEAVREKIAHQSQEKSPVSASSQGIFHIFCDGGSRGNPGCSGAGWVIKQNRTLVKKGKQFLGIGTNNQAEYQALIAALNDAKTLHFQKIKIHLDSELVVKQILGQYKVKNAELKELFTQAQALLQTFPNWEIVHIRRELNTEADAMANEAMDRNRS